MDKKFTREEVLELFKSESVETITNTLLYITFNFEDWEWIQNMCLNLLNNENEDVRRLAVTCLGHIARIHAIIDKGKVIPILQNRKDTDLKIAGSIEDTLQDIEMYTS